MEEATELVKWIISQKWLMVVVIMPFIYRVFVFIERMLLTKKVLNAKGKVMYKDKNTHIVKDD